MIRYPFSLQMRDLEPIHFRPRAEEFFTATVRSRLTYIGGAIRPLCLRHCTLTRFYLKDFRGGNL